MVWSVETPVSADMLTMQHRSHLQDWILTQVDNHLLSSQFLWRDGRVFAEALKHIYNEGFKRLRQVMDEMRRNEMS